jgi:adenine-specific DNA-methyltransferase
MYMCRETVRRAVIQKFNEKYKIDCDSFDDLKNFVAGRFKAKDILEFNTLINSLKICDPAVGSGHFLVSALNEVIAIKAELGILADKEGLRLTGYDVKIENDELIVTYNDDTEIFEYSVTSNSIAKETQRVQKTLFHEKELIIENSLFGVDINPNSVKICRLRLWIELLKNAYYTEESKFTELETLPNIDINIKCGNSLISRFPLDSDLKKALKGKWNIDTYKIAVHSYHEAENKEEKRKLEELIDTIKKDFRIEIGGNDPRRKKLVKLKEELFLLTVSPKLQLDIELKKGGVKLEKEKVKKVTDEINRIENELIEIENNKVYENAFEWRFEFPEVLDNNGGFIGFDVVIGNPPYLSSKAFDKKLMGYLSEYYVTSQYQLDLYVAFMERGISILRSSAYISFITPNSWLKNMQFSNCRKYLLDSLSFKTVFANLENVFTEASVDTLIFIGNKSSFGGRLDVCEFINSKPIIKHSVDQDRFKNNDRFVFDVEANEMFSGIIEKVKANSIKLESVSEITRGVNPYDKYQGQTEETIKNKVYHANFKKDKTFRPEIRGKHVNSYSYNWDGKHYISYGDWLAAPREEKFFEGPRLIVRQVLGEKLNCALIDEDFIIDQSVFIAKPKKENLKHINAMQGILASKLIAQYFKFTSNEFDALFPKIKIGEFRELPLFKNMALAESNLGKKVAEILKIKKSNPDADTSKHEKEIDKIVYNLFGLSEEEIRIIEEN